MIAPTSQILFIVLLAILLPSALSFPYSIYNMRNRRASRVSSMKADNGRSSSSISNQAGYTEPRQQHDFDQLAYRPQAAAPYYGNYDTLYDSGADSFYADDGNVDDRPEREYLYGKPTYHGEYKPTRYYYARAPSYSYAYGDRMESNSNPLDDLHEEMLQEDHNRQRIKDAPPQWLQNAGQPSSLTGNFMKNLMLHNNGMDNMDTQSMDMNAAAAAAEDAIAAAELPAYDDEDIENPNSEPYDYFDPLKFQHVNQYNHYGSPSTNKQIYYQDNRNPNADDDDEEEEQQRFSVENKNKNKNKNRNQKQNQNQRKPATHKNNSKEDKDEKDLESLRKSHNKNSSNRKNGGGRGSAKHRNNHADMNMNDEQSGSRSDKNTHDADNYNGGYDTGFDYDEDAWINWNRKRSLPNESLRPLKALEQKLTDALKFQAETMRLAAPTPPPPSTQPSSSSPSPAPSKAR